MAKKGMRKTYVVWKGRQPGLYDTWAECQAQVEGVNGAQYRGYTSRAEAEEAFSKPFVRGEKAAGKPTTYEGAGPVYPALAVDAACNMRTGRMEYRGVDAKSKKEVFAMGPFEATTNNVGEFLALVHALALLNAQSSYEHKILPIYSDSKTAIAWVRRKQANTKMTPTPQNEYVRELIMRAERWLHENTWRNPILKWDTEHWGEIPADYGRK